MILKRVIPQFAATVILACGFANARGAIIVHTSDFIADNARGHFNSFEPAATTPPGIANDGTFYTPGGSDNNGSTPYSFGGITVQQVGSDATQNLLTYFHPDGQFGWYPQALDGFGYTKITLDDHSDFGSVGFNVSTGWATSSLYYELREVTQNSSVIVDSGSLSDYLTGNPSFPVGPPTPSAYIGFSGGGFNEIWVRDLGSQFDSSDFDFESSAGGALAIDAIETPSSDIAAPEPASLTLWGIGALGLIGYCGRWRRKDPTNVV